MSVPNGRAAVRSARPECTAGSMTLGPTEILAVAVGGAAGGCARLWLAALVDRHGGGRFPWGTLAVNVSGAAVIGVAAALPIGAGAPGAAAALLWTVLVVGVLGSYTTVSSFSLQTLALLQEGRPGAAALNIVGSFGLCIGAAFVAHATARSAMGTLVGAAGS